MKILWLAWKDKNHPGAGGAEVVMHELSDRLLRDGHQVTILTARYPGAPQRETLGGIEIIRVGNNRYLHPFQAFYYYLRHLRGSFDEVIETVNTAPYFAAFFNNNGKKPLLFYHQLARKIWHYEAPLPISHLGYWIIEPLSTFALGKAGTTTMTVSRSTKADLKRFGFRDDKVHIVGQGIHIRPAANLDTIQKYSRPTILSLGAARGMKRTVDQVKAFEIAKKRLPDLAMMLVGDTKGRYGQQLLEYIAKSPYKKDITHLGRVSSEKKIEVMQRCHLITVTSVKEGWGLIVSEAASQGTPAVVYNVDGLRDSVKHDQTGIITDVNPSALADGIISILQQPKRYEAMRQAGWEWSKELTFDKSYDNFMSVLQKSESSSKEKKMRKSWETPYHL